MSLSVDTSAFSRRLADYAASLAAATDALSRIGSASLVTARVIFERLSLLHLLPRAGARRQLLHQGRAPKGRR